MNKLLCSSVFLGILSMQLVVTAAPMISVDSVDFDAGTVYEGAGKSVKHTFTIKIPEMNLWLYRKSGPVVVVQQLIMIP